MITLRKRLAGPRSRLMLLPALLFLGGATMTLFGGGVLAALCLVPAGIAVDHAFRDAQRQPDES